MSRMKSRKPSHSDEVQAGRLENRGQAELTAATRLMTLAERHLTATDTGEALKAHARRAGRRAACAQPSSLLPAHDAGPRRDRSVAPPHRRPLDRCVRALARERSDARRAPRRACAPSSPISQASPARWNPQAATHSNKRVRRRAAIVDLLPSGARRARSRTTASPRARVARRRGRRTRPRARSRVRVAARRIRRTDAGIANAREAQCRRRRAPRAKASRSCARPPPRCFRSRVPSGREANSGSAAPRTSEPGLRGAVIDALRAPGGPR